MYGRNNNKDQSILAILSDLRLSAQVPLFLLEDIVFLTICF